MFEGSALNIPSNLSDKLLLALDFISLEFIFSTLQIKNRRSQLKTQPAVQKHIKLKYS